MPRVRGRTPLLLVAAGRGEKPGVALDASLPEPASGSAHRRAGPRTAPCTHSTDLDGGTDGHIPGVEESWIGCILVALRSSDTGERPRWALGPVGERRGRT